MIEFQSVTKKYNRFVALNQLSFTVRPFEFVALVGNNGSGKSTIINIISSLVGYEAGRIKIFDRHLRKGSHAYKKRLGIILEESTLHEDFRVAEFFRIIGKFYNLKSSELKKRIHNVIKLLNIEHDDKTIGKLSAGTGMKVQFAASLLHNPELLVYDEPFRNLDIQTIEIIKNLLKRFKGKKTLFITSHNLDLVADICDRFLIIDSGQLIAKLKKSEYENVEQLKNRVKTYMTKKQKDISLSWLS